MSKFSPSEFIKKLKNLMLDPVRFFEEAKGENWTTVGL